MKNEKIIKTVREELITPVKYECDVCVAGGGVAGIAAAISAARAAKKCQIPTKVMLLERGYMLGGLATAGLVTIYLAICDGLGNQICYGLSEELFRLSIEYGIEDMYPKAWLENGTKEERAEKRFQVQYNAQFFAISAERVLREEGVEILYGATASEVKCENGKITHVIIEGKGGREAIKVNRSVVDCTGDADICKLSGAKTEVFSQGNKLAAWYYGYGSGKFKLYMCGVHDTPDTEGNTDIPDLLRFSGLDTKELSKVTEVSHTALMNNILERRKSIPDLVPTTISTTPEVRMTRRLSGKCTLGIEERHYDDSVGVFPNWKKRGPVYELPLCALYGKEVKNLLTAGRCISTNEEMWDITRVIPVCAVTGEAAGAAATLSDDVESLDIKAIQSYLTSAGVKLDREAVR